MVLELIDSRAGMRRAGLRYGLAKRYRGGPYAGGKLAEPTRDANRKREIIIVNPAEVPVPATAPEHLTCRSSYSDAHRPPHVYGTDRRADELSRATSSAFACVVERSLSPPPPTRLACLLSAPHKAERSASPAITIIIPLEPFVSWTDSWGRPCLAPAEDPTCC